MRGTSSLNVSVPAMDTSFTSYCVAGCNPVLNVNASAFLSRTWMVYKAK